MSAPAPSPAAPGLVLRRLLRNAGILIRDAFVAPFAWRVPREWIVVRLDRGLVDLSLEPGWMSALHTPPNSLQAVLEVLERAGRDPRVRGVLVRVGGAPIGWSKASSLTRAIAKLRESGKLCVVYAERTGNAGTWLGAAADRFWMTPEGHLDLLGVRVDSPFVRELLERFRVRPDVLQAGRYKGAGELLDRTELSPASREALDAVVDELYGALVEGLAGRAGSEEEARAWIDDGPYLASEALERGLIDAVCYGDELPERLAELAPPAGATATGDPPEVRPLPEPVYRRLSQPRFAFEPLGRGRPRIALVPVAGMIRSPEASARPIVAELRRLARRPDVRAVVLCVNSPGGDPLASDLLWRAVGQLREAKPVVAWLSDAAASGGYYVAMAAHELVAERTTLTGSIGVVLAALGFEQTLAGFGIHFDGVSRGRHSGLYAPYRTRSAEERQVLSRQVKTLYRAFVAKVAASRGRSVAEIEKVAEGRVWSGAHALENGLVDTLGGLSQALERARALAGLAPDEGEPLVYTPPPGWLLRMRGDALTAQADPIAPGARLLCPFEIPLR